MRHPPPLAHSWRFRPKTIQGPFDGAAEKVIAALKEEGFGVLTDIDVSSTLKTKLGIDWRPYRILGACNPQLAHRALQSEDKIGVMLPRNVIAQELANGMVEVATIDPTASTIPRHAIAAPLLLGFPRRGKKGSSFWMGGRDRLHAQDEARYRLATRLLRL
jgi:uncharacterized protein (DUF302 family)